MSNLLARLTGNILEFVRHEHSLLERSHELYSRAACLESTYARYEKPAYLRRRTRVRQFNVSDLDTPLNGSADAGQVHLKELEVQVWHARDPQSLALGGGRRFTVRMLKSK